MAKLAIVLCAVFFASAANGLSEQDVKNAEKVALTAIDEAYQIINADVFHRPFGSETRSKLDLFVDGLWRDVRNFLLNNNINQEAKNKLVSAVGNSIRGRSDILVDLRRKVDSCRANTNSKEELSHCYKNIADLASVSVFKIFPPLIAKVNQLSEAECRKNCILPDLPIRNLALNRGEEL